MLKLPLKTIQEHIELLKNIKWLKENADKMLYPQEINMNDLYNLLDKLETQIIRELFELIKTNP